MAAPLPGSHANRIPSRFPPPRPSMWPRHMQPRKPSGSEGLSQNSFPFHPLQPPSSVTTKLQSSLQSTTTTMPEPSISTFASNLSGKSSRTTPSHLSTALQMTWQPTSSPSPYQNGKSQCTSAISGYVAFEGEWWIFLALQLVLTAHSGAPLHLMGHFTWPTYFLDPCGPRAHILCSPIRLSPP